MISGDIKTIKLIDKVLSEHYKLDKDSSNRGSRVYTKTYLLNPHGVVRVFFDEREGKGTIKLKNNGYPPVLCGAASFAAVQAVMLIVNVIQGWF